MPRGTGPRKAGEPFELGAAIAERALGRQRTEVLRLDDGVKRCARCGGDHPIAINALPLTRPMSLNVADATHYFFCPTNGQPVMVVCVPSEVVCGEMRGVLR